MLNNWARHLNLITLWL